MRDDNYVVNLGDCLEHLAAISSDSIDLVYLDPPFFTQRPQKLSNKSGKEYSFSDTWESFESYKSFISERLEQLHRVLKPTGSIFLHCDTNASHHLRDCLDKVFGAKNFRSEIIWTYKRWSNSKMGLLNAHQTILYYSKSQNYKFNQLFVDYSPTTNLDQILQERVRDNRNKAVYKTDELGNVVTTKEKKGVPLSDVWDIPFLNPKAKERTGYPTQKPVALLLKILEIATDPGDIVLDPFCGSGTTLVAAALCERKAIGFDISEEAVNLTKSRLEHPFMSDSALLKNGAASYITKDALTESVLKELGCKIVQRNKGIDGLATNRTDGELVAVKIQRESESFLESANLLYKAAMKKNCKHMVLIRTSVVEPLFEDSVPDCITVLDAYKLLLNRRYSIDLNHK